MRSTEMTSPLLFLTCSTVIFGNKAPILRFFLKKEGFFEELSAKITFNVAPYSGIYRKKVYLSFQSRKC